MFKRIDMERWPRRETYAHFMRADCSYSLTRQLCITAFYRYIRERGVRFFPAFTWAVMRAVNRRQEFRMGLDEQGRPGFYDKLNPEYTVFDPASERMESLNTAYCEDFAAFYAAMLWDIEHWRREGAHTPAREDVVLLSCIPWFSYTDISLQMKSSQFFLRPMFLWGRFSQQDGAVVLPFTLQVHHAAADGYHCHLFFEELRQVIERPQDFLSSDPEELVSNKGIRQSR